MLALERLTPMGSEFWEDPVFCEQFIRDRLQTAQRLMVEAIKAKNGLLQQIEILKSGKSRPVES